MFHHGLCESDCVKQNKAFTFKKCFTYLMWTFLIHVFKSEDVRTHTLYLLFLFIPITSYCMCISGQCRHVCLYLSYMCHTPDLENLAALVASLEVSLGQIVNIYVPAVISCSYCSSTVTPLRPVLLGKKTNNTLFWSTL